MVLLLCFLFFFTVTPKLFPPGKKSTEALDWTRRSYRKNGNVRSRVCIAWGVPWPQIKSTVAGRTDLRVTCTIGGNTCNEFFCFYFFLFFRFVIIWQSIAGDRCNVAGYHKSATLRRCVTWRTRLRGYTRLNPRKMCTFCGFFYKSTAWWRFPVFLLCKHSIMNYL